MEYRKISIGNTSSKGSFSIAMLVYRSVFGHFAGKNPFLFTTILGGNTPTRDEICREIFQEN